MGQSKGQGWDISDMAGIYNPGGPQPSRNPFMMNTGQPYQFSQGSFFGPGPQMPFFGNHPMWNFNDFSWVQGPLSPNAPITGQGLLAATPREEVRASSSRDVASTATPKTVNDAAIRSLPASQIAAYGKAKHKGDPRHDEFQRRMQRYGSIYLGAQGK